MKICKAKIDGSWQEVPFYGVFQYSDVIGPSLMVGGHQGGVIAYPVAVVELDNQLIMRSIDSVKDIKDVDEESGLSHLAHMACNLAFICELMKEVEK